MSAAVTRLLSIVYGSITIGGTTDYLIDGPWSLSKSYGRFELSCVVVIASASAATETTFETACTTLEAAFRKPRQELTVTIDSRTHFRANPTAGSGGNTGFDAEPSIEKVGDRETDTGRSRLYRIRISGILPADLSGENGLRTSTVTADYTPSRRLRITIAGEYTALDTLNATAVYNANIAAYATTELGTFTGTFELVAERFPRNRTDKVLTFERVYEEIILDQAAGVLNHPAIVSQVIGVEVANTAPGDSPLGTPILADFGSPAVLNGAVKRPVKITLSAFMSVDKTVTQDLRSLWLDTIRPWMIYQAFTLAGTSVAAIESIAPRFDPTNNTIGVSLSAIAVEGNVLECVWTVGLYDDLGNKLVSIHGPNPLAAHLFQGPRVILRRLHQTLRMLKGSRGGSAGQGGGPGPDGGAGGIGAGIQAGIGGIIPPGLLPFGSGQGSPGVSEGSITFGIGAGPPGSLISGWNLNPSSNGANGGGVAAGKAPNDANLADVNIKMPGGLAGTLEWVPQTRQQEARPEKIGIDGYSIQTVVLDIDIVERLRALPPPRGNGGPAETAPPPATSSGADF